MPTVIYAVYFSLYRVLLSICTVHVLRVVKTSLYVVHFLIIWLLVDLNAALTSSGNVVSSTKSLMSKRSDDIPTLHRRNVNFQAPSFPLIPPFWNKIESILQKVGLSTLSKQFADGKIDPHVILAMSESCLIRLGVETREPRPPQRKLQTVLMEKGEQMWLPRALSALLKLSS